MVNTNFVTDGAIGARLAEVTTTEDFELGTRIDGNDGSAFIFCQANGAITGDGFVVMIDEDWQADMIETTVSANGFGKKVGIARVAFADNDFGWIQVSGTGPVRVAASAAANTELNTTATGGQLDDDATVGSEVVGRITIETANGGAAATVEGSLTEPTVGATL